jgi:hypothetical protein
MTGWFHFFPISTIVALPRLLLLVWMMRSLPIRVQQANNEYDEDVVARPFGRATE